MVWSETYSTLYNEKAVAGACDADGNLYVVGRAFGTGFYDLIVQCYHGDFGTEQWSRTIGSPVMLDDVGWDIAVDHQGHPIVCGLVGTSLADADAVVVKYDPVLGEELWRATIPGAVYNIETQGGWVAVADNDDVILAMRVWDPTTGYDVLLKRLAAADGQELWSRRWNSGGTTADDPRAMCLGPTGDVLVAGVSGGNYLVACFDGMTGEFAWHGSYAGPPDWYDVATCLGVAADGTVIASGYSDGSGTGWDLATVAFDPVDGTQLWAQRFDGYTLSDEARALAVSPAGDVAVIGYAYSYDQGNDALVVCYDMGAATAAPDRVPSSVAFTGAYPNPFNPSVTLAYSLPIDGAADFAVYDLRGHLVATLVRGRATAGPHTVQWHGTDEAGHALPSGVYLAVLRTAAGTTNRKLVLAR
ncbi:MAG: PQQ-binding-like beta-propeller repeat protein [Candidatus Krumholzibacteriia bacterium]